MQMFPWAKEMFDKGQMAENGLSPEDFLTSELVVVERDQVKAIRESLKQAGFHESSEGKDHFISHYPGGGKIQRGVMLGFYDMEDNEAYVQFYDSEYGK